MAENEYLEPKRFDLSEINNGKKYKQGDGIQPNAINAPLEASSYILGLTDNIDISNIAGNGEPSVEIVEDSYSKLPHFVFKNLKGEKGVQGEKGDNGAGFYITTSAIPLAINSSITLSLSVIQYPANITPKVNDIIFSISSISNGYFGKITAINTTNSTCTVVTIANFANEINSLTLNVNDEETIFDGSNPKTVNINYSNKNLLINPDFKINQRESTTYTYSGTASYTVDRWTFLSSSYNNSTLTPNTGSGMTLYNQIGYGYIIQYIETPLELSTQYTISANSPYGTLKTTFTTPSSLPTVNTNYSQRLGVVDSNGVTIGYIIVGYLVSKGFWYVMINNEAGETLTLNWVKLEKGAIATPFVTPNPTEEMLKCQRYFFVKKGQISAVAANADSLYPNIPLPVPLRISTPTLTVKREYSVRGSGGSYNGITDITLANTTNNNSLDILVKLGNNNLYDVYQAYSLHNGIIWFDAEI